MHGWCLAPQFDHLDNCARSHPNFERGAASAPNDKFAQWFSAQQFDHLDNCRRCHFSFVAVQGIPAPAEDLCLHPAKRFKSSVLFSCGHQFQQKILLATSRRFTSPHQGASADAKNATPHFRSRPVSSSSPCIASEANLIIYKQVEDRLPPSRSPLRGAC